MIESIIILIEIIKILSNIIRIFWFVRFQIKIFLSVEFFRVQKSIFRILQFFLKFYYNSLFHYISCFKRRYCFNVILFHYSDFLVRKSQLIFNIYCFVSF